MWHCLNGELHIDLSHEDSQPNLIFRQSDFQMSQFEACPFLGLPKIVRCLRKMAEGGFIVPAWEALRCSAEWSITIRTTDITS